MNKKAGKTIDEYIKNAYEVFDEFSIRKLEKKLEKWIKEVEVAELACKNEELYTVYALACIAMRDYINKREDRIIT